MRIILIVPTCKQSPHPIAQSIGIISGCSIRYAGGASGIRVTKMVNKGLESVGREAKIILEDEVVGRLRGALDSGVALQKEVVAARC